MKYCFLERQVSGTNHNALGDGRTASLFEIGIQETQYRSAICIAFFAVRHAPGAAFDAEHLLQPTTGEQDESGEQVHVRDVPQRLTQDHMVRASGHLLGKHSRLLQGITRVRGDGLTLRTSAFRTKPLYTEGRLKRWRNRLPGPSSIRKLIDSEQTALTAVRSLTSVSLVNLP